MVILVTGGMGFIGSHTVQALTDLGHSCVVTSHQTTRELGGNVSIEQVDVADRDAMFGVGRRHAIDGIVHLADPTLAHLSDPSIEPATLLADVRAGANALFNVLGCAIAWNVRRVTVASSIGVYGGVPDLRGVGEELPLHIAAGGNVVAASKKSAELIVSLFREHGVDGISARLPAVWGPRGRTDSRFFAAPGLIHAAVSGESPARAYADDAIDLLYIKDCARAIALLQTAARLAHSTYNVGSGHATSNADVAAAIERAVPGAELPLEPGLSPHGAVAYLDTTRLQADTAFEPEYDLERAVADYLRWLRTAAAVRRESSDGMAGNKTLNVREEGAQMASARFVIYKDKGEKYRWRLVSSNGQETASSGQHFESHQDAKRAAEHVKEHAATAEIVEE